MNARDAAGRRRRALGLALAALALLAFGHGGYILAKAQLAQVLLARAWSQARAGQPAPRPWPWADTHPVARLIVESHDVDLYVLAGTSGRALAFGPGHLESSARPGSAGNSVLAAHRDTHFAFLRDVAEGEVVLIETPDGRRVRYRLEAGVVRDERDTALLGPVDGRVLTLVTCYPFDAVVPGGPLRYVVRGVAVGT